MSLHLLSNVKRIQIINFHVFFSLNSQLKIPSVKIPFTENRICAVDRGFELHSSQTKDYAIGICCFSAEYAALRDKTNAGCLGATCLAAGCYFNAQLKSK